MSDDVKPPENPTKKIPSEEIQAGLLNKLVGTVTEIKDGITNMRADLALVSNDLSVVKDRVALVETRTATLEQARAVNSERAKSMSQADMTHDAAIAKLITDVAEVKTDTKLQNAILGRLDKVATNPLVKEIAKAIGTAILVYLGVKGFR
jgi:hypothetical protein